MPSRGAAARRRGSGPARRIRVRSRVSRARHGRGADRTPGATSRWAAAAGLRSRPPLVRERVLQVPSPDLDRCRTIRSAPTCSACWTGRTPTSPSTTRSRESPSSSAGCARRSCRTLFLGARRAPPPRAAGHPRFLPRPRLLRAGVAGRLLASLRRAPHPRGVGSQHRRVPRGPRGAEADRRGPGAGPPRPDPPRLRTDVPAGAAPRSRPRRLPHRTDRPDQAPPGDLARQLSRARAAACGRARPGGSAATPPLPSARRRRYLQGVRGAPASSPADLLGGVIHVAARPLSS